MSYSRSRSIAAAAAALCCAASVQADSYRVFPMPVASPDHGSQTLVSNPADTEASPFGWHDTNGAAGAEFTILRGNNVTVYVDADGDGTPDGQFFDGGAALTFDFPWAPTQEPGEYAAALATNAFYWGNRLHDIFYRHGFNEVARNMQTNNYGRGGIGGDPLRIEILSGASTNDTTWVAADEGESPRLRTHPWTFTTPAREGSFDATALIYGYGKIVESRLSAQGCFGNAENPTSGYADFLAVLLTNDFTATTPATPRALATYLLGQPITGTGIRPVPYTSNMAANPITYANTGPLAVPHGVGTVWASAMWDLTWLMVKTHGASNDWLTGNGGENRMLRLTIRAQQLQVCSAGFVGARNALLAADEELYTGENRCRIWKAFAGRGLGFSAAEGSVDSNADNVAAFDMPGTCDDVFADGFEL